MRVHRRQRHVVRVEVADLLGVLTSRNGSNLGKPELRAPVDHPRIHEESRPVDDARITRGGDVGAYRLDAVAADDETPVLDPWTGDGDDGGVSDDDRGLLGCPLGRAGCGLRRQRHGQDCDGDPSAISPAQGAPAQSRLDRPHGSTSVTCRGPCFCRMSSIRYSSVGAVLRSKKTRPSINVISTRDAGANGWPLKIARSASLPTSMDPTRLSMPSCHAGWRVIIFSASSSDTPP